MALVDPFMPQKRPTVFRAKRAEERARQPKEPRRPQLVKYRPDVSGRVRQAFTDYRGTEVRQPAPWTLPEHGGQVRPESRASSHEEGQGVQTTGQRRPELVSGSRGDLDGVPKQVRHDAAGGSVAQPVLDLRGAVPRGAQGRHEALSPKHEAVSGPSSVIPGGTRNLQPSPSAAPQVQPTRATSPVLPTTKKSFTAPPRKQSRFKAFIQTTAVIIWALAMGLGIYSQTIGEFALLLYAFVAIIFRLSSQFSFGLALAAFAGIIVAQVVKPESSIAGNIAVYAFLLLAIGSLSLGLEIRQQGKWSRRSRPGKKRKK